MGNELEKIFTFKVGASVQDIFEFTTPPTCPWNWSQIKASRDLSIELQLRNDDYLRSSNVIAKYLKGSVHVFDPTEDSSYDRLSCLLLLSPKLKNLKDLRESGLTLSSLSPFSMQREHLLLSEHYASETRTAHRLQVLSQQLEQEKRLSNSLLEMMLPEKVAADLRAGRQVPPEQFESCSIFFSDIVGFTAMSSNLEPIQVVELLNQLYTVMDNVTNALGLYKVETIGDAYMVVGGIPRRDPLHAIKVANFAVIINRAVQSVLSPLNGQPIKIRIGIHSGKTMAGVVGNMMPRYCLFGDTVNTASRMESNGEAGCIHISEAFYDCISSSNLFKISERGKVQIKGKGDMRTFWIDDATDSNFEANTIVQEKYIEISRRLVADAITKKDTQEYKTLLSDPQGSIVE